MQFNNKFKNNVLSTIDYFLNETKLLIFWRISLFYSNSIYKAKIYFKANEEYLHKADRYTF